MPQARSSRQPTTSRTPVSFAASCARTIPARLLQSTTASAFIPMAAAVANSSAADEAPRRNEKCEVTCNSA